MIKEIGTDIVSLQRLNETINRNPNFINKTYTSKELELAAKIKNPLHFYATRFAAKEAIFKATGAQFEFNQIEILKDELGKPIPHIINHPDIKIKLSLSYEDNYAIAFCIIIS